MTKVPTDIEIAQRATPRLITEVAEEIGLSRDDLVLYGDYKAKIRTGRIMERPRRAKLVLVTGISPTPAGKGNPPSP